MRGACNKHVNLCGRGLFTVSYLKRVDGGIQTGIREARWCHAGPSGEDRSYLRPMAVWNGHEIHVQSGISRGEEGPSGCHWGAARKYVKNMCLHCFMKKDAKHGNCNMSGATRYKFHPYGRRWQYLSLFLSHCNFAQSLFGCWGRLTRRCWVSQWRGGNSLKVILVSKPSPWGTCN